MAERAAGPKSCLRMNVAAPQLSTPGGSSAASSTPRGLEPVHRGHAHIEEHEFRLELLSDLDRFLSRRGLPDDRESRRRLDDVARDSSEDRLIVDEKDADRRL